MNNTGYTKAANMVRWNISGNTGYPSGNKLNDSFNELGTCMNGTHRYDTPQLVLVVVVTASLSLVTILGNMLVMLSIKVNRKLQTINNYFLFSLACADLITGLVSMNLYTLYITMGRWPLGAVVCDLWLVLDYVVSNASVMNLLIISFDRYFCVTRPLSYPARRTARLAGLMIAGAWLFPLLLWTPAILCWQSLTGKRIVSDRDCYIQLLSSPAVTLATTLPSFYLPAAIMIALYARISLASHRRLSELRPDQGMTRTSSGSTRHVLLRRRSSRRSCELEAQTSSETDSCYGTLTTNTHNGYSAHVHQHQLASTSLNNTLPGVSKCQERTKRRILARERKVTRTISAILLTFILTWTPYNVMAVVGTFCRSCIPDGMWIVGYWLCYINSTVNPGCYAMCNVTFRKTFRSLLQCQCGNMSRKGRQRASYAS